MTTSNTGEGKGARLKRLRLEYAPDKTAAEVAKLCHIHPVTLSKLEAGTHEPSLATCRKLADGLGIPLAHVVGE